jgi:Aminopeptidase N
MKFLTGLALAAMCTGTAIAQDEHKLCSHQGQQKNVARVTIATPEEDYYDIKHLQFDINLTNQSTDVGGNVTTTAQVLVPTMSVYAFELHTSITLDSVKINNQLLPATTTGAVRKVTIPSGLPLGSTFTAQVFYHGTPPNGGGFFSAGLYQSSLPSGVKLLYTLSDPYNTDQWWPCKQSLQDKIDSADIWITVPADCKAGSNGLLKNVTTVLGGKRYEWKTTYPIVYYLISAAVAPYADYSYYMHYTDGSGDSLLIQNYVYDSLNVMTAANKATLDTTGLVIDYFSKLFGRYPFQKEKYGHCYAETMGGGMEHQTMTTLGRMYTTVVAHEAGHQWWGNHVTYKRWEDVWLSEGFASYTEHLFVEHFRGAAAVKAYRTNVFNKAATANTGTVRVDDTANSARIFDGLLTYDKGAAVVHMLRYMAPDDNTFFNMLKNFQQQYSFGLASTADLHTMAEQYYNRDLDTFFDQWIYKEGCPRYSGKWYKDDANNLLYIRIDQATSAPNSISFFTMPVEVLLKSPDGDEVVKLYNNAASQSYKLSMSKRITGIEIDPNDHILNKTGTITEDPTLKAGHLIKIDLEIQVYPNPASSGWKVNHVPKDATLQLSDMSGKIVWSGVAADTQIDIPAAYMAPGNYVLRIDTENHGTRTYKLVK